jgi:hypothetical protein
VTAVDLTATRKQMREEGHVPRLANGSEWHFNTAVCQRHDYRAHSRCSGEITRPADEAALHVPVLVRAK